MYIFLSYAAEQRAFAARLNAALRAEGYSVFFDRSEILAGDAFDRAIRSAIEHSDLIIFLATPAALRPGAYTLSELQMAEQKCPSAEDCIVPVLFQGVCIEDLPPYLRTVSALRPPGEPVAEILASVAHRKRTLRVWHVKIEVILGGFLVGGLLGAIGGFYLPPIFGRHPPHIADVEYVFAAFVVSLFASYLSALLAPWSPLRHAVVTALLLVPVSIYLIWQGFYPLFSVESLVVISLVIAFSAAGAASAILRTTRSVSSP
jgi:hypothetical protein